ncbi:MOB kinase activator family [Artemisia annua]|uniref:MOB kinase activator family n=1 Tax=Artemisia annua TaxID=35608 RepID=A0A2U1MKW3_ARTAN|nr:MOB kinase activator family [Artemisia annua]
MSTRFINPKMSMHQPDLLQRLLPFDKIVSEMWVKNWPTHGLGDLFAKFGEFGKNGLVWYNILHVEGVAAGIEDIDGKWAQLKKHIDATLGSGNLRKVACLPLGEDLNKWLT